MTSLSIAHPHVVNNNSKGTSLKRYAGKIASSALLSVAIFPLHGKKYPEHDSMHHNAQGKPSWKETLKQEHYRPGVYLPNGWDHATGMYLFPVGNSDIQFIDLDFRDYRAEELLNIVGDTYIVDNDNGTGHARGFHVGIRCSTPIPEFKGIDVRRTGVDKGIVGPGSEYYTDLDSDGKHTGRYYHVPGRTYQWNEVEPAVMTNEQTAAILAWCTKYGSFPAAPVTGTLFQPTEQDIANFTANIRRLSPHRADDRSLWIDVCYYIKLALGDAGFDLFDEFSQQCPNKYDPADIRKRWDGAKGSGGDRVAFRTVAKLARLDNPISDPSATYADQEVDPASYAVAPVNVETAEPYYGGSDETRRYMLDLLGKDELGDALMLQAIYEGRIAYDAQQGIWYLWAGHRFAQDRLGLIRNLVDRDSGVAGQWRTLADDLETLINQLKEQIQPTLDLDKLDVTELTDDQLKVLPDEVQRLIKELLSCLGNRKAARKRIAALHKVTRSARIVARAAELPGIATDGGSWDQGSMILPVKNGVIDLRTGELASGKPSDRIRTAAPIEWMGIDTIAPRWNQFLGEVFNGNTPLIDYVQRLIGYSISGVSNERILPILYGVGANGKSVLIDVIGALLGDFAKAGSRDLLLDPGGRRAAGSASPHLADLQSRRLVYVSETREGGRLDTSQVKNIVGAETISARPLFGAPISFTPTHVIWLLTNHRPAAPADDTALWDRLALIPFTQRFVEFPDSDNEQKRDPELKQKLLDELPGILAWAVRGCMEWQRVGLCPPDVVKMATQQYREDSDVISIWLAEMCEMGSTYAESPSTLYKAYCDWSENRNERPKNQTNFKEALQKRGVEWSRQKSGFRCVGLKLLTPTAIM